MVAVQWEGAEPLSAQNAPGWPHVAKTAAAMRWGSDRRGSGRAVQLVPGDGGAQAKGNDGLDPSMASLAAGCQGGSIDRQGRVVGDQARPRRSPRCEAPSRWSTAEMEKIW